MGTKCRATFPFRSQLYNHLKSGCLEMFLPFFPARTTSPILIIASKTAYQFFGSGLGFRSWMYATTLVTLTGDYLPPDSNPNAIVCLDTGYRVILVDKACLSKCVLMQKISTISTPLKWRKIRASKHKSGEFVALSLYFSGKNNAGQQIYAFLTCKIYLVKSSRVNLLIGNDIISLEGFIIDIRRRSVLMGSCGITVSINVRQKGQFLTRRLFASQETVVFPHSEAMILLVPLPLPNNQDFLFWPST